MFKKRRIRRAYLLRFWAERGPTAEGPVWRFNLEDPHSGQRQGFSRLDTLVAYLEDQMRQAEAEGPAAPDR